MPCITPSVQLKGSSKKLTDFRKETYWLMLDYDDVPPKNIAALRQTARKIPFTMVFYITVSGKGFRILLRYMRPEGCNLTATELHQLAIRKAMSVYDKLLGISCDKQCQDMVRSCGLAYDPEAYFNWNAEVFAINREEVEEFEKATKQQEEQSSVATTVAQMPKDGRDTIHAPVHTMPTAEERRRELAWQAQQAAMELEKQQIKDAEESRKHDSRHGGSSHSWTRFSI